MLSLILHILMLVPSLLFLAWMIFSILSIVKGAPFVRSNKQVVETMLSLAQPTEGERSADIGSGSGRVVIAFALAGAQAWGYEINGLLVIWSRILVRVRGVVGHAFIKWGNIWQQDFSRFSIVTVYGIPHIMASLEQKLCRELPIGARIISNTFQFPTLRPISQVGTVYLYSITASNKEWAMSLDSLANKV